MLFTSQLFMIRVGSRFVKQFSSRVLSTSVLIDEHKKTELISQPENTIQRKEARLLKVAILGTPNAGKSTLINKLMDRKVCPVSRKVHTTMHKAQAIYTKGNTQIVFLDTPGIVSKAEAKKYKLNETFEKDPCSSLENADVIGIVQDVANRYTRHKISDSILNVLQKKNTDKPLLLIFTKIDMLKKKKVLLELTSAFLNHNSLFSFDNVFMVSGLKGDGVEDLKNYLIDLAKPSDWQYDEKSYIDQSFEKIVADTVRAKLMDTLPEEMPYKIEVELEYFDFTPDGSISTAVILWCPNVHYYRSLLKKRAVKLRSIAVSAEEELRHAFKTHVLLKLNVQTRTKSE